MLSGSFLSKSEKSGQILFWYSQESRVESWGGKEGRPTASKLQKNEIKNYKNSVSVIWKQLWQQDQQRKAWGL